MHANIFAMVFDLLGAVLLAAYAIIVGPLGVLRGPLVLERFFWYLWVLLPQGLMARSVHCAIDWRLGNFDGAIAQLEGLVGSCEDYYRARAASRTRRRVLEDLYTVLVRAYLHAGHIDDAMLVVIRAKKCMNVERLPGLAELDAKTAHLVRAGLAAGRLLDGGGLATMFVKSSREVPQPAPRRAPDVVADKGGQGEGNAEDAFEFPPAGEGAKIIPFPAPRDLLH